MISDIESEKGTRSRANDHILLQVQKLERIAMTEVRKLERIAYAGMGGLAVLQVVLTFIFK